MKFDTPLIPAKILKKHKRFLVDFTTDDSSDIQTASTNNTGPMLSCWEPGWNILLSQHDNPKRKYKHTLEMTSNGKDWIGVNTILANRLTEEAILNGTIQELQGYTTLKREVKYGKDQKSKIDFLLSNSEEQCYVEVKCTTYNPDSETGIAEFPDTRSLRAEKHLDELIGVHKQGCRAILLYVVSREDCHSFRVCKNKAPEYAKQIAEAANAGFVEILAYQCDVRPDEIRIQRRLPVLI